MSFYFVDHIVSLTPKQHIRGTKTVSDADIYLRQAPCGRQALFPAIVGEALGQLGAWCAMQANQFTLRPVAGIVGEVVVHDYAYVGETITLDTTIDHLDEQAVQYHSLATVDGRPILQLKHALGPFLAMTTFNKPQVLSDIFEEINTDHAPHNRTSIVATAAKSGEKTAHWENDYTIVDWQIGESFVAHKKINEQDPYFPDHFPDKPVFPMSLLLDCKMQLTTQFAQATQIPWPLRRLRKIKMSDFIVPGSDITIKGVVKKRDNKQCLLTLTTELSGKRVCIVEAELSE